MKKGSFASSRSDSGGINEYEKCVNASFDGSFIVDRRGGFREVNRAYCEIVGYTREELLAKSLDEIESKGSRAVFRNQVEQIISSGHVRFFSSHRSKDGRIIDVEISIVAFDYDGAPLFLVFCRDVEPKKELIWRDLTRSSILELSARKSTRREFLDSVVELLTSWSGCENVGIRLFDDNGYIPYVAFSGFSREFVDSENTTPIDSELCSCIRVISLEQGPADLSIMTPERAFHSNNVDEFIGGLPEQERARYRGICTPQDFKSVAIVPFKYQEYVSGVIHIADTREDMLPLKAVSFLQSIAPLIGEAIYRFNVETELKESNETQSIINSILLLSLVNISLDEILDYSLDLLFSLQWLTGAIGGIIFLIDQGSGELVKKAQKGLPETMKASSDRVPVENCMCGDTIQKKQIQMIKCESADHLGYCVEIMPHSHYCVPIIFTGKVIGLINILMEGGHKEKSDEEQHLTAIANTLAGIIVRAQRDKELLLEQHKLQNVLKSMNDGVIIVNEKCDVEFTNPIMVQYFGEPVGRKCYDYIRDELGYCQWCRIHGSIPVDVQRREMIDNLNGNSYDIFSTTITNADNSISRIEFFHDITERKRYEREIAYQANLLMRVSDAIISFDENMRITYWNSAAETIYGWKAEETIGRSVIELLAPVMVGAEGKEIYQYMNMPDNFLGEMIHKKKDGIPIYIEATGIILHSSQGGIEGYITVNRDITKRKIDEAEMMKLLLALEQASDWVIITDKEGTIEYTNNIVEVISGYKKEEIIGRKPNILKSGKHDDSFYKNLWETVLYGQTFRSIFINRKKNGELFYIDNSITPLKDSRNNITHFVASGKDITQQKNMEDRLISLVHYDILTGLPNRTLFNDKLNQAMARAEYNKRMIAILLIDLDRFKFANDTFGMRAGDEILKNMAGRLQSSIRDGDILARMGSDEFGIVLIDVARKEDFILLVEKIMGVISQPMIIKDAEIVLTATIGISIYPFDGDNARALMQNADVAFTKAKFMGRNHYQFYTAGMNLRASEFLTIEKDLFKALDNDEFVIHYQPYYEINSRTMVGMESLIRWNRKNVALSHPDSFVPILEETGMIIPVGLWMIRGVSHQIKKWVDKGYPVVPVSVNLSPVQFKQADLADVIEKTINEYNIDCSLLVFELTENVLMQDLEYASAVLQKLRGLGCSISVDDFGIGYSSFGYLKTFALNNIKIDKSFIRDIDTDPDSRAIVAAIISLSRNLNLKTIAEGVETEEQLNILRDIKCDFIQGYFLSEPVPASDIEKLYDHS